jgi:hypothetical protein
VIKHACDGVHQAAGAHHGQASSRKGMNVRRLCVTFCDLPWLPQFKSERYVAAKAGIRQISNCNL